MNVRKTPRPGPLSAWLVAGSAAVAAGAAGPAIRRLMVRGGIVDDPNERSSHATAVPRGGGWACLAGMVAGCATGRVIGYRVPWKTAGGGLALALVGFADDRWSIPALPRLVAQLGVGAATDVATHHLPTGLLTVPTLVNVVNFMDGINGITCLTTAVWGANASALGLSADNDHVALLGASLGGAALGFLPHNLSAERMFLGDVGSYLIGATMALTALHPSLSWHARARLLSPLLPYLADSGLTLVRRAARGDNVLEAHREHVYQKLANERGLGHVPVAALYAALAATSAFAAHCLMDDRR